MPYDFSTLPGAGEARLLALQSLLQDNLSSLNASLQRGGLFPGGANITASMVVLGDPETLPADVNSAPLTVCVTSGGRGYDTLDRETDYATIGPQYRKRLWTNILVHIHPLTAPDPSARAVLVQRVIDWLSVGVLDSADNSEIALTSRELALSPAYDVLSECKIERIEVLTTSKQTGDTTTVTTIYARHSATLL